MKFSIFIFAVFLFSCNAMNVEITARAFDVLRGIPEYAIIKVDVAFVEGDISDDFVAWLNSEVPDDGEQCDFSHVYCRKAPKYYKAMLVGMVFNFGVIDLRYDITKAYLLQQLNLQKDLMHELNIWQIFDPACFYDISSFRCKKDIQDSCFENYYESELEHFIKLSQNSEKENREFGYKYFLNVYVPFVAFYNKAVALANKRSCQLK